MVTESPKVVSLFCGCGGLDLGFVNAGFEVVYACDNDKASISCYKQNIDDRVYLTDVNSTKFRSDLENLSNIDVVLGGFPCQGFSKAGPKKETDERNVLYKQMKWAVKALQPRMFIAENVDGVSQNFKGVYVKRIINEFRKIGYNVEYKILDALTYGLPQFRRRIIFVGTPIEEKQEFEWPLPTHKHVTRNGEFKVGDNQRFLWEDTPPPTQNPLTIRDAIYDLVDVGDDFPDHRTIEKWPKSYNPVFKAIGPGQKLCNVRHADTSVRTWDIPETFGKVTKKQVTILETIAKYRRHKKYGNIPNGNPIPVDEIERLSGKKVSTKDVDQLLSQGYIKKKNNAYDLKGAMFCSGLFKRPEWDAPSPTVLTVFHNPRYFLHPSENRPFTLRECARLQGFPDTFMISEGNPEVSLTDGYRLIGNAVPPPLAENLANSVACYMDIPSEVLV